MTLKDRALRRLRRYAGTDWVAARVAGVEGRLARLDAIDALEARAAAIEATAARHERQLLIHTVMGWVALATVPEGPLVSVIMPTRDRAPFVLRAYDSLAAQAYGNWELVVVDDGSVDDTPAVVGGIDDDRVRLYTGSGSGACGARNIGLDRIKGDLVAYLDDDNVAHPNWLKAVVWAFAQRPDVDALYAGFVIDDPFRLHGRGVGGVPELIFEPYDPARAADEMLSDMSAIAHRAGTAGARFDESLREMGDWDFLLQLTREKAPLALPFLACSYMTDAPGRLSFGPTYEADRATVRARHPR
jgi:Glycosyl transferase family 2